MEEEKPQVAMYVFNLINLAHYCFVFKAHSFSSGLIPICFPLAFLINAVSKELHLIA